MIGTLFWLAVRSSGQGFIKTMDFEEVLEGQGDVRWELWEFQAKGESGHSYFKGGDVQLRKARKLGQESNNPYYIWSQIIRLPSSVQ